MKIPVIFSYARSNKYEKIPNNDTPFLYQLPHDYTLDIIDQIIEMDFDTKEKIFMVSYPTPDIIRFVGILKMYGWKVLYDVRDEWEEFHKVDMARWYDEAAERYFVANCDVVCAVARPLMKKIQKYTSNKIIQYSPNALDISVLDDLKKREITEQFTIGYFGHLTGSWFRWDTLIEMARKRPNWQFDIIGHFEPKNLNLPKNILLLGSRTHKDIKEVSRKWSVAIIPFKIGQLYDCSDPIKVYEYLALGLPVVSSISKQLIDYPMVSMAKDTDDYIRKIEIAAKTSFDKEAVDSFLSNNTWEIRANHMLELLKKVRPTNEVIGGE